MSAQVCEHFEICYFDQDHQFIKWRRDNHCVDYPEDTGVKMTIIAIINNDKYGDKEYGKITVRRSRNYPTEPEPEEISFNLRHNSMLLLKSRLIDYQITAKKQKVFAVIMRIAGPKTGNY